MLQPQLLRSDGSIPILEESVPRSNEDSRLQSIIDDMENSEASTFAIVRRIEAEMARAIQMMVENGTPPSKRSEVSLRTKIKALRVLAIDVRQTEKYRQKQDVLDLDGPKFTFVINRVREIFQQGLGEVLGPGSEDIVQRVLRYLRDEFVAQEPEIRNQLKRMS